MMGLQQPPQSSLFYIGINIDKRVRENHPLRKVDKLNGAILCQGHAIRLRSSTMAKPLANADPGISDLRHPEHPNVDNL